MCRWHRTTPFFVSDPCHSSMRPLFTLAPPLESCWVPTSLTPAILQDHEKTKMSVRKVTKQFAVSRVYCSMLFQFFGSGASLDIKLRPHCCSLSFAIFSLETWQLLKEHHQMIACDQEFDSDTVCLIQVQTGSGPGTFSFYQKQRPFVPQTLVRIMHFIDLRKLTRQSPPEPRNCRIIQLLYQRF